jgi:hypothetical protein
MDWTTGRTVFDPRQRQEIFPLISVFRSTLEPTQPPVQWVLGVLCQGVKRGLGVMLTTHPHLVPRSWTSRSYISSSLLRPHRCVVGLLSRRYHEISVRKLSTHFHRRNDKYQCGNLFIESHFETEYVTTFDENTRDNLHASYWLTGSSWNSMWRHQSPLLSFLHVSASFTICIKVNE